MRGSRFRTLVLALWFSCYLGPALNYQAYIRELKKLGADVLVLAQGLTAFGGLADGPYRPWSLIGMSYHWRTGRKPSSYHDNEQSAVSARRPVTFRALTKLLHHSSSNPQMGN